MGNLAYHLSDSVIARIAQILQEGLLTGTDIVDHLRMLELQPDDVNPQLLVMTTEYAQRVKDMHQRMLEHIAEVQAMQTTQQSNEENN